MSDVSNTDLVDTSVSAHGDSAFTVPQRQILKIFDLNAWFFSKAYQDYMSFLHKLNDGVIGVKTVDNVAMSPTILALIDMLDTLKKWILEYPAEDMESQRFGNKAYRKWHERLEQDIPSLLSAVLPDSAKPAVPELVPYLLDSFGNATRIDYGSGHEASFMHFVLCLYKLNVLTDADNKATVLRLFNCYVKLCRSLQVVYHMEPAGSRGVHALDDFQFLPFLFGSAQLIGNKRKLVPDSYTKSEIVDAYAHESLFLEAVRYINDTKTGPFHEHSNQLWNVSAVAQWEKVNGGMFKMYEGEVLKKFPVVQHFVFGSLFSFEKRPDAPRESLTRQQVEQ